MSAPAKSRYCKDTRLLGAYLDGELDPQALLEIETHLSACDVCRERVELDRATRQSLKGLVRDSSRSSAGEASGLRSRALAAMMAEQARGEARAVAEERGKLVSWRTMVPIASAAALALTFGALNRNPFVDSGLTSNQMRAGFGDDLLAEFVGIHNDPMPLQVKDESQVRQLDRYIGVPVHLAGFERGGARLLGAGVFPVHRQRALLLQYVTPSDHRVGLFITNPKNIRLSGPGLAPHTVGTAEVRSGRVDGYSVAIAERGDIDYTAVSDLDPDGNAQQLADWTQ
jgi:anti-sigma factor RsiW